MAIQTLVGAAEAFETLGVPRWAERARDEAGRVGLFPTKTTLTKTERRVAELVASGMSNHEVAAALFMSVNTVEANLTRVYRTSSPGPSSATSSPALATRHHSRKSQYLLLG